MKSKIRWIVGIVCFFIMLIAFAFIVQNWDTMFDSHATFTYHDGCVEEYINEELVNEECTNARQDLENQKNGMYNKPKVPLWNLNLT